MHENGKRGVSRRRTNMRVVLVLASMLGAVLALGYWDQHRYDAKVPLGTWYGAFTSPTGSNGAMLVVVKRKPLGPTDTYVGQSNGVYFRGSAQLCFPAQARQYFRLSGFTDHSGPGFTFYLAPAGRAAAGLRFSADGLHGARHQDSLTMSGHLISFGPAGDTLSTADPTRQTPVTLANGDGRRFSDTCRALRARSQ